MSLVLYLSIIVSLYGLLYIINTSVPCLSYTLCFLFVVGGTSLENGSVVQALVLDISRAERLVDLSLRPELINSSAKEVSNSQSKKVSFHKIYSGPSFALFVFSFSPSLLA